MSVITSLLAAARRLRTKVSIATRSRVVTAGVDLHIGRGVRLWAPEKIQIGNKVHIGKDVCIECNAEIGDYVLIANRVAFVGRHDHDFREVGVPIRFARWIGGSESWRAQGSEKVIVEQDVWIGYGAIILTGVRIERGSIVGAGAVVVSDVPSYSIVVGSPARVVGKRFPDAVTIAKHEERIRKGSFSFSERGYEYWEVSPGSE